MIANAEPMTTLDDAEWRAYKRSLRHLQYTRRMQQVKEAPPAAFLEALRRDDAGDPFYEDSLQEQQRALEAAA